MREALVILRKDVRHLWPPIVLVLAVTALEGWLNAAYPTGSPIQTVLVWLWGCSCVYLAASAVQEESLPGHEQYWLTRPYSRWRLLLAKVLLLAIFAVVPRVAAQAAVLAMNGISPVSYASVLFLIAVFSLGIGLAAASLAAVTGNPMQFLWVLLPVAALEILGVMRSGRDLDWDNVAWIRSTALGAIVLAAAIAVLMVQYLRRRTVLSGGILAVTVAITALGPYLGTWHSAFALESKLGRPVDPSAVGISFEPSLQSDGNYSAEYGPSLAGIDLPVRITGIPAGAHAISERVATTIEAPGNRWLSNWTSTGAIANPNLLEDSRVIRADGPYRQHLYVDAEFYRAVKDTPVHLHVSVALTLLGEARSAALSAHGRTGHLPGDGICQAGQGPFPGNVLVYCAWPGRAPARAYVQARSLQTGRGLESLLFPAGSYAPYAADGSVWSSAAAMVTVPPDPVEMKLQTWRAVAHFERDLDIPQIRLGDYAVRRITDSK